MSREQHEEQACLYALDLLGPGEKSGFKSALATSPDLQALTRDLRNTASALAFRAPVVRPPDELKSRVLESVACSSPARITAPPSPWFFRPYLPWAAAAALAACAAWLAQGFLASRAEADLLRSQNELAELALQSSRRQLEAERLIARQQLTALEQQVARQEGQVAQLTSDLKSQADLARLKITALASMLQQSPQALAVAVWNPTSQEGVLQVDRLPALLPTQDYQLWVVDPQYQDPVDGGVFIVDPETGAARITFKARQPVSSVKAFAVTLERKGGVPKAEGPFVLLGK